MRRKSILLYFNNEVINLISGHTQCICVKRKLIPQVLIYFPLLEKIHVSKNEIIIAQKMKFPYAENFIDLTTIFMFPCYVISIIEIVSIS